MQRTFDVKRASLLWLLFAASAASAHAVIVSSQPAAGANVAGPSLQVELRFNSRIDPVRSRLELIAPDGRGAALPIARSDAPDLITAPADGLRPGSYRLRWQVMSLDGHITRGDLPFEVTR
jgi:methionine-rich copper-binding protein CopC